MVMMKVDDDKSFECLCVVEYSEICSFIAGCIVCVKISFSSNNFH